MKKTTKSLIAAVAAVTLCAANIPMASLSPIFKCSSITASAAEDDYIIERDQIGVDAFYTLDKDGVLTISGTGAFNYNFDSMNFKKLIIEEGITEYNSGAFEYNKNIEEASLPGTIKTIWQFTFSGCSNLKKVTIASGLEKISKNAFMSCNNLETVIIPDTVTSIEENSFFSCENVNTVYCYADPNNLSWEMFNPGEFMHPKGTICYVPAEYYSAYFKKFGDLNVVFERMPIATSGQCGENAYYTLNDDGTLTITGTGAIYDYKNDVSPFRDNLDIKSVVVEEGITYIPEGSFVRCYNIESATLSAQDIGDSAFAWCNNLKNVTLENGVEVVENAAFGGCTLLETVTIPETLQVIANAFQDDNAIEAIYCKKDINSIIWYYFPNEFKPWFSEDRTKFYMPLECYLFFADLRVESNDQLIFEFLPMDTAIDAEMNGVYNEAIEEIELKGSVYDISAVNFEVSEGSSLPAGLDITNGVISGTPEAAGDFTTSFDLSVFNHDFGTLNYTFHIDKVDPVMSVKLKNDKITTKDVLTEKNFIVESSVSGTVTWENLGNELTEGEVVLTWIFTPDDETNYNSVSGTITINVEAPEIEEEKSFTLTNVQYGTTYDLSEHDCEHISGISIKFANQANSTTNGCVVLGNYVSTTLLNNVTVNGDTIDIAIDQYSLQSALDTFTIYDWYNTAATLGEIESVTFYYTDDEEINIAPDSVILQNSDNETANQFDLSEYDYENVQSVTLVFNGITYNGCGAIITGEYGNIGYNFNMNRTNNYSITIDVNGELTDKLNFSNYWNLKELSYIALNY